jgi:hypothetical protein
MASILVKSWNDRWRLWCQGSPLVLILLLLALPASAAGEATATLFRSSGASKGEKGTR